MRISSALMHRVPPAFTLHPRTSSVSYVTCPIRRRVGGIKTNSGNVARPFSPLPPAATDHETAINVVTKSEDVSCPREAIDTRSLSMMTSVIARGLLSISRVQPTIPKGSRMVLSLMPHQSLDHPPAALIAAPKLRVTTLFPTMQKKQKHQKGSAAVQRFGASSDVADHPREQDRA